MLFEQQHFPDHKDGEIILLSFLSSTVTALDA